jgi:hypothetical protein
MSPRWGWKISKRNSSINISLLTELLRGQRRVGARERPVRAPGLHIVDRVTDPAGLWFGLRVNSRN